MKNPTQALLRSLFRRAERMKMGGLAAALMISLGILGGTPALAQNFTFSNVVVEGNQRIESATILTYLGFGRGETVSAGMVNDAAQNQPSRRVRRAEEEARV